MAHIPSMSFALVNECSCVISFSIFTQFTCTHITLTVMIPVWVFGFVEHQTTGKHFDWVYIKILFELEVWAWQLLQPTTQQAAAASHFLRISSSSQSAIKSGVSHIEHRLSLSPIHTHTAFLSLGIMWLEDTNASHFFDSAWCQYRITLLLWCNGSYRRQHLRWNKTTVFNQSYRLKGILALFSQSCRSLVYTVHSERNFCYKFFRQIDSTAISVCFRISYREFPNLKVLNGYGTLYTI